MVFHPRPGRRRSDIFGSLHGVGVGGVDAEVCPLQKSRHLLRFQPSGPDGDTGSTSLLLRPEVRRHADEDIRPKGPQLFGERAALGGTAEHDRSHRLYPRGVTIRPASSRVAALPMKTVVNISTCVFSSSASVRTRFSCPSRHRPAASR